jgi:hypothetical protein
MTEAAGGQHTTATVQGGAATLSGGLGQRGISIISSNGTKVRLASNMTTLKSSATLDASDRPGTIAGGASGLDVTAGTGNFTLRGGHSHDIVQIGAGATVHGGTGQNFYEFVKGAAGGVDRITGFKSGIDRLQFQGYGKLNVPQTVGESPTTMHLSDGTVVVILPDLLSSR